VVRGDLGRCEVRSQESDPKLLTIFASKTFDRGSFSATAASTRTLNTPPINTELAAPASCHAFYFPKGQYVKDKVLIPLVTQRSDTEKLKTGARTVKISNLLS
jgi:hypothetical protein